MAARGSAGLLLCVGLLFAMPALAATPADRGECAASADKPDLGFAACSRIIDDASASAAERVKAFKNRGRGSFNSEGLRPRDCRLRRGHQAQPEGRLRPLRTGVRPTRARRITTRPLRIAPRRSGSIRNMAGPTTTVASPITVCMNTTLRWPTTPRRSGSIPGTCGPMPATAWRGWKRVNSTQAVADITEAVTIDPKYAFGFGQRGQALFRKRLITKKGGWEPAIADYSRGHQARSKSGLAVQLARRRLQQQSPIRSRRSGLQRGHQARTQKFQRVQLSRRRLRRLEGL